MIIVNDLKPGITIEYENNIYVVLDISLTASSWIMKLMNN